MLFLKANQHCQGTEGYSINKVEIIRTQHVYKRGLDDTNQPFLWHIRDPARL